VFEALTLAFVLLCLVANPKLRIRSGLLADAGLVMVLASLSVHALIRSPSTSAAVEIALDPSMFDSRQIILSSQEVLISISTLC
jgi:hypothetical protein